MARTQKARSSVAFFRCNLSRAGRNRTVAMFRAVRHPINSHGSVAPADPSLYLAQTVRFEINERARPTPIVSNPINAIRGSGLAVFGRG